MKENSFFPVFPTVTLYAIAPTLLTSNHKPNHIGNSTLKWLRE